MKKERGITLVAVVVTIIVLIILAGVVIAMLFNNGVVDKANETKFSTQIATFYEEYNTYLLTKYLETLSAYDKENLNADNREEESNGIIPIKTIMPSMKEKYFLDKIKIEKGEWVYSGFAEKEEEIIDRIINKYDQNIPEEEPETPGETDNKYIQEGVNKPILPVAENVWEESLVNTKVLPVTYKETGEYETVTDLTKEWYNYKEQTLDTSAGGTSKWANIRTEDGSLWVWIPRYAYKITSGAHIKVGWEEINRINNEEAGTVEIKFLKENTNEFWDGTTGETITQDPNQITYTDDGTKTYQNEWFIPASFKFNDKPLNGFWVGKYEASCLNDTNGDKMSTDNVLATKLVAVLPGKPSWRYIEMKNMFGNCIFMGTKNNEIYGFKENTNTHLMKNDEWGSTAYLAHSKYGRNGTAIKANTSEKYITGTGGPLASTTGNYYGVFDMVGGSSDAVSAVHSSDKEGLKDINEHNIDIREYVNIYDGYSSNIKGDAMYETSLKETTASSWFKGLSWIVKAEEPRMTRGGMNKRYDNGGIENPSIFGFYRYKTVDYQLKYVGFRPAITYY